MLPFRILLPLALLSAALAAAAFDAQVANEAPTFYEGHLFPYVLPVLALGSRSRRPDADSGPVIAGLGMSSTGFGLGAARVLGDAARFARLDAELVAFPQLLAPVRPLLAPQAEALGMHLDTDAYLTGLLLGDVAMLWGVSWEDWGVSTPAPTSTPPSTGTPE